MPGVFLKQHKKAMGMVHVALAPNINIKFQLPNCYIEYIFLVMSLDICYVIGVKN